MRYVIFKKGFTLIELLVVIAIVSLLSTIVLSQLNESRAKARDAQRIQQLEQIGRALELYYSDNGQYPVGTQTPPDYSSDSPADWAELEALLSKYISKLPIDPANGGVAQEPGFPLQYVYATDDGTSYDLITLLETNNQNSCNNAIVPVTDWLTTHPNICVLAPFFKGLYNASPK